MHRPNVIQTRKVTSWHSSSSWLKRLRSAKRRKTRRKKRRRTSSATASLDTSHRKRSRQRRRRRKRPRQRLLPAPQRKRALVLQRSPRFAEQSSQLLHHHRLFPLVHHLNSPSNHPRAPTPLLIMAGYHHSNRKSTRRGRGRDEGLTRSIAFALWLLTTIQTTSRRGTMTYRKRKIVSSKSTTRRRMLLASLSV